MTITANTKIARVIKQHPDALEAIISISPAFTKLRNPLLRKALAGRASIAMAARIGGCNISDFFSKLEPLGFTTDCTTALAEENDIPMTTPDFLKNLSADQLTELDVRPVIASGKDPLQQILEKVKTLKAGAVLKIINSFKPAPLMQLLGRQGFESYATTVNDQLVYTYFYKTAEQPAQAATALHGDAADWNILLSRFENKLEYVDVRAMQMPLPMHTILEALNQLPPSKALFVHHKRIPVFLLPELQERKFSYRIKEIADGEVQLLIYQD